MFKKLNNIGDCGIVCDFGEKVNREINISVIKLFHHVKKEVSKGKLSRFLPKFSRSLNDGWAPILTLFFLEISIVFSIVGLSPA